MITINDTGGKCNTGNNIVTINDTGGKLFNYTIQVAANFILFLFFYFFFF